jgi:hypothetical protein
LEVLAGQTNRLRAVLELMVQMAAAVLRVQVKTGVLEVF